MIKGFISSTAAQFVSNFSILVAVWALCIAQPMYQVLSAGATFFAAHNAGPIEILMFILLFFFILKIYYLRRMKNFVLLIMKVMFTVIIYFLILTIKM